MYEDLRARGRAITRIVAVLLVVGPAVQMLPLLLGHWRFPPMLWVVQLGPPTVFAVFLLLRQNWMRLVVGWISILTVAIDVTDDVLRRRSLLLVLVRSSLTIIVAAVLLWSPSVRGYFKTRAETIDALGPLT